jgi:hypothetical protein
VKTSVVEDHSRSMIEFAFDPLEIVTAMAGQVCAFRKVLAEKSIGRSYVCQVATEGVVDSGGGLDRSIEAAGRVRRGGGRVRV